MVKRTYLLFTLTAVLLAACSSASGSGFRMPQGQFTSLLERKSGRIVYIGLDGNVYTIDQSGGSETQITDDAHPTQDGVRRFYDFPTWSAEDNKLAFVGFEERESGEVTATIYSTPTRRVELNEIYSSDSHVPFYLYWSPDGEWVSFLSSNPGASAMAFQIASAEGDDNSVVDTGRPYYWAWAPHGEEVVAHVGGSASANPGAARVSLLDMDATFRQIGLGILPTSFQAPAYSPDGEYMLLADESQGMQRLLLANAAGRVEGVITEFRGNIAFDWAPRGNYAAYVIGDSGNQALLGRLAFVDLRRPSAPEIVETGAEDVLGFFWAPDGRQVAYFVPVRVPVEPAEGQEPSSEDFAFLLELYVADARTGEGELIVRFQPAPAFLNILPFFDQYQRSATIWSPDSNFILLSAIAGEDLQGLFVVPASGNFEPRFIAPGQIGYWSWE